MSWFNEQICIKASDTVSRQSCDSNYHKVFITQCNYIIQKHISVLLFDMNSNLNVLIIKPVDDVVSVHLYTLKAIKTKKQAC